MKKVFTMFSLLLACLFVHAESKFYFDAQKIKPGETKQIELSLLNESICEGFQLKVTLPENVSFVEDEDEEDYFMKVSDRVKKKFNVECSLRDDGSLNLVGYLSGTTTIDAGDGPILVLFVKADDNATIGTTKIKISNAEINLEGSVNVKPADEEFDFSIYDVFTITPSANDSSMGSVEGGGEVESGNSTTVTATAAEGYHFVNWTAGETAVSTDNPYSFTAEESVTLTANFAPNQYAMTFVLDNGQDNVVLTQDYATELSAPADPTKTGFTFAGWDPVVPATVPASAQTFTAQWTRNNYNLTFVVDGESNTTSVAYEAPITKPADPVKEGYTFTGWDAEVAETMPAQDLTYTAQFTINQYAMTFVLDNGQDNVVLTQDYATELSAPADPTKTGFTFAGWDPAVPATVPAAAQTFTAQWTRNNYNLTFNVDGESTTTSVAYEVPITKPADPVKEGYTFTGWDAEVAETMPAQDLTYTAQFTINQYAMTFVLDNGQDNVVLTQDYATELSAPADPTKTGFTFAGWSPAVPATVPASAQTFTAQWTRNNYNLTFNVDGESTTTSVAYEAPITAPADPVKEGYTFTGWDAEIAETMPAQDLTYTAQFTINQYAMTFVLDNGQDNVVLTQDYATELSAPADPTKSGFTFAGWSPAVPATVPASAQTFTAQWTRNNYNLTFVVDGESNTTSVAYEAPITAPADPVKEGYTFTGWDAEIAETMPAEDLTYTAQFTINTYAVIYMVDGQEWSRDSVVYGGTIEVKSYEVPEGMLFSGWSSDEEYTTMPAHDVVYSATLTINRIARLLNTTGNVNVYSLNGVLVARNVPVEKLQGILKSGTYIVNGKKINIK